jgi:hypothetical protein
MFANIVPMHGYVRYWHKADNQTVPVFVRYWTKADKVEFFGRGRFVR